MKWSKKKLEQNRLAKVLPDICWAIDEAGGAEYSGSATATVCGEVMDLRWATNIWNKNSVRVYSNGLYIGKYLHHRDRAIADERAILSCTVATATSTARKGSL